MNHTFASDNYSGVHPEIIEALIDANHGHEASYGSDRYTKRAVQKFKNIFGNDISVFFVYNGTGANVLGLSALTRSFEGIICSNLSHIHVDESTATETFIGCRQITVETSDGKITPEAIERRIQRRGDQHHPQAKVISISQSTEYGTVYSPEEIAGIASVARKYNLYFHMDGSRICNAAVSLKADLKSFTADLGVDVLSFGGTKNGLMFGEAVIIFNQALAKDFSYMRKQGMQLHSKMRFIAAQFEALLTDDLWKRNAANANAMAALLANELEKIPEIRITKSVDANGVFAVMPPEIIPALQEHQYFYVWNEELNEARLMCSFNTTKENVEAFVQKVKELLT